MSNVSVVVSNEDQHTADPVGFNIKRNRQALPVDWNQGKTQAPALIDGGCFWQWWFTRTGPDEAEFILCCGLDAHTATHDPATGEDLAAVVYYTKEQVLHIGTEDDKYLRYRAKDTSGALPQRFGELPHDRWEGLLDDMIRLSENGIRLTVPELQIGETMYFHVIAAYKRTNPQEDISTWLAVDRRKSELDSFGPRP
jgi:hypothetical protein